MKITWTSTVWNDYLYWQTTYNKKLKRINQLVKESLRDSFYEIRNLVLLKHDLYGVWSRRIYGVYRLVYSFEEDTLIIVACRYHY